MEYFKLFSFLFLIIYFLLFSLSQHNTRIIQQIVTSSKLLIHTSLFLTQRRGRERVLQSLPHPFFFAFSASPYFIPPKNTRDRFHYNQPSQSLFLHSSPNQVHIFIYYFLVVNIKLNPIKINSNSKLNLLEFFFPITSMEPIINQLNVFPEK